MVDHVEGLAHEGGDQQCLGLGLRDSTRLQIEDVVMVQVARRRAMAAGHVIGIDFEFRLRIELGRLGQQQRMARLLAIRLLRMLPHNHLALKDAPRMVIHHALEQLPAGAVRHAVVNHQPRIRMLLARQQIGARHLGIGEFAVEAIGPVLTVQPRTGGECKVPEGHVARQRHMGVGQMRCLTRLDLGLHPVKPCIGAHANFGDAV